MIVPRAHGDGRLRWLRSCDLLPSRWTNFGGSADVWVSGWICARLDFRRTPVTALGFLLLAWLALGVSGLFWNIPHYLAH